MENWSVPAELVEEAFKKMPSYNPDSDIISTEDIPTFLKCVGYERSQEQIEAYTKWGTEICHGKLPLSLCTAILGSADNKNKYTETLITLCDFDKSGFISADEYKVCVQVLSIHFPDFPKVDFDVFSKEADQNEDGKVSIDEALGWIKARI